MAKKVSLHLFWKMYTKLAIITGYPSYLYRAKLQIDANKILLDQHTPYYVSTPIYLRLQITENVSPVRSKTDLKRSQKSFRTGR